VVIFIFMVQHNHCTIKIRLQAYSRNVKSRDKIYVFIYLFNTVSYISFIRFMMIMALLVMFMTYSFYVVSHIHLPYLGTWVHLL
jgi:hypothetical protein